MDYPALVYGDFLTQNKRLDRKMFMYYKKQGAFLPPWVPQLDLAVLPSNPPLPSPLQLLPPVEAAIPHRVHFPQL